MVAKNHLQAHGENYKVVLAKSVSCTAVPSQKGLMPLGVSVVLHTQLQDLSGLPL